MRYTGGLDTGHVLRHYQVSTELRESGDLAALNAVAEAIAGSLNLTAVLEALGRVLADRLGVAGGAAFLRTGPDSRPTARANWGVPARALAAIEARLQAGWDDPAATDDLRPAEIISGDVGPFLTLSVERADPPLQSCVCIPFSGGAGSPGVLVLFGLAPTGDEAARTAALELLGRLVGAAVRNARLHARVRADRRRLADLARRLIGAQEEERRRIARELHEEIAQTLAAARISEMLAVDGSGGPDAASPRAENIGILSRTIDQIRELTLDLRPITLDDLGIVAALRSHLAAVTERAGLALRFDADPGIGRLLPELETACFRVAQEAVANAVRHAEAREVRVRLRHVAGKLALTVADDGRGFDVPAAAGHGFGIPLMRERAFLAGGRLRILSHPGEGTVVRMILLTQPTALDPAASDRERRPGRGPAADHPPE